MIPCRILSVIVAGSLAFVAGCASEQPQMAARGITCNIPTIAPQAETKYSQEKGGLEISVAPADYQIATDTKVTLQAKQAPALVSIVNTNEASYWVERTYTQTPVVKPAQVRFLVKINNKMPRVFYGKGTVVQFNVGGRLQPVDQTGYNNFLGAIIPPRQEQQIEVVGPPLSALTQNKGVIGIFLYDVVTNQSAAGEVTEKQNYEWYFDYTLEGRTLQIQTRTDEGFMPIAQYQQEMMQQQSQSISQYQGMYPPGSVPPASIQPYGQ